MTGFVSGLPMWADQLSSSVVAAPLHHHLPVLFQCCNVLPDGDLYCIMLCIPLIARSFCNSVWHWTRTQQSMSGFAGLQIILVSYGSDHIQYRSARIVGLLNVANTIAQVDSKVSAKPWPLRLCLFIICICTSFDSDSHCSSCRPPI
jgi:hypothetical protein